MSNQDTTTTLDNVQVEVKVKSTRPPFLTGKYSKILLFGFQFIEQLKTHNLLSDIDASYQLLSLFSSVEDQTEYFDNFFLNIKSSTKEMKLVLKNKLNANKPVKATKGKNTTISNVVVSNDVILTDANASEKKRGRKKKDNAVVHDKQDQIVIDLIAAANNPDLINPSSVIVPATTTAETTTTPTTTTPAETTTTTAAKYKRKPKKDAAIAATQEHIQTINAANEDKPKSKPKKLGVKPITPVIEPTQPVIEPTQPVIEPTQPVIEPTQPVIEPTQPIIEKKPKTKTEKKPETEKKTKTEKKPKNATKSDNPLPIQPELVQEPLQNIQLIIPTTEEDDKNKEITTEEHEEDDKNKEITTEEDDEEEEEIEGLPFTHNGIHYVKDDNHIVYDKDTFDVVGKYNKNTNTINPISLT